jgi:hypothetical protein
VTWQLFHFCMAGLSAGSIGLPSAGLWTHGGSDDHAGANRHHRRLYRLPGGWGRRSDCRSVCGFCEPHFFVLLAAPYYRRFASNPQVKAFVEGVTAAAVGAIAGAAFILARVR